MEQIIQQKNGSDMNNMKWREKWITNLINGNISLHFFRWLLWKEKKSVNKLKFNKQSGLLGNKDIEFSATFSNFFHHVDVYCEPEVVLWA